MPFTVLSKGVLSEAEFLFEKLTKHEDNDSFIFILGYTTLNIVCMCTVIIRIWLFYQQN
jgi:hypothetical protein